MAHNVHYAGRIREILSAYPGITERENAAGLTFMFGKKICAWVKGEQIIVRCAPAETGNLVGKGGVSRFTMKGREQMRGWLIIDPEAEDLPSWIAASFRFVAGLS